MRRSLKCGGGKGLENVDRNGMLSQSSGAMGVGVIKLIFQYAMAGMGDFPRRLLRQCNWNPM